MPRACACTSLTMVNFRFLTFDELHQLTEQFIAQPPPQIPTTAKHHKPTKKGGSKKGVCVRGMLRPTSLIWAKTLSDMMRRFRVAGAHPDIIYGIDPDKAKNNGDEFIRLEEVLSVREMGRRSPQFDQLSKPHSFVFWIQTAEWLRWKDQTRAGDQTARRPLNVLAPITCTLTPQASDAVVKKQLGDLFKSVNLHDDFSLVDNSKSNEWTSLQGAFHAAGDRHVAFTTSSGHLLQQADGIIDKLRQMGTFIIVNIDHSSLLASLPLTDSTPSEYRKAKTGFTGAILVNPLDLSSAAMKFMDERGLKPLDLQSAGSESAIRQFVFAFDKILHVMTLHRGKALRSEVTIIFDIRGDTNRIANDNTIVLSLARISQWEEFLFSISQPTWIRLTEHHRMCMSLNSPIVEERKRKLARIAESFGVFSAIFDNTFGSNDGEWQQQLLLRLAADEGTIKRTLEKYNIKDANAKKRVMLHFSNRLASSSGEAIDYRIGSTGHIFFHAKCTTPQILKVLRSNLKFAADKSITYDRMLSRLSRAAQLLHVNMSIDESLKRNRDGTLVTDMTNFVAMIEKHVTELTTFTKRGASVATHSNNGFVGQNAMNWVISERFDVTQTGTMYLPFDIDFKTLKQHLLK